MPQWQAMSETTRLVMCAQEVDLLLYKWDTAAKELEIAEAAFEASELTTRPTTYIGGCCCFGRTKVPCPPSALFCRLHSS